MWRMHNLLIWIILLLKGAVFRHHWNGWNTGWMLSIDKFVIVEYQFWYIMRWCAWLWVISMLGGIILINTLWVVNIQHFYVFWVEWQTSTFPFLLSCVPKVLYFVVCATRQLTHANEGTINTMKHTILFAFKYSISILLDTLQYISKLIKQAMKIQYSCMKLITMCNIKP